MAATIVQKADRLQNEYNVLYSVHREGTAQRTADQYFISNGVEGQKKKRRRDLLSDRRRAGRQVDNLLRDNVITAENVYSNIESGL